MIKKLKLYLRPVELSQLIKMLKFFIIFINGGILSLTDSHHNHHGQKPTMVGICHGGNVLGNLDDLCLYRYSGFCDNRETSYSNVLLKYSTQCIAMVATVAPQEDNKVKTVF